MWAAAIAVPIGLGLLLWRDGPVRKLLDRSAEAKAQSGAAPAIDTNAGAQPMQDGATPDPVAKPHNGTRGNATSTSLSDRDSTRSLSDTRAARDLGSSDHGRVADSPAYGAPIQNVSDGKDAGGKTGSSSSSDAPEKSAAIAHPATSTLQLAANGADNKPVANATGNDEVSRLPIASNPADRALGTEAMFNKPDLISPNTPRPNNRPMNVLPDSATNSAPTSAGAAKSPVERQSPVEDKSSSGIFTDVPEGRVTEVRPPKTRKESFVNLPGERVLESPSMTMHIQRSVLVPGEHKWLRWPLKRSRKDVVLGELVSRVDPETSPMQLGSGSAVSVRAIVDKDGHVENVVPVSGSTTLLPIVVQAVGQWRYEPTYLDDKPVETETYILIDFHLPTGMSR